jgi:hypothetical protein
MNRRLSISNSKRKDQSGTQTPGSSTNFSLLPLLLTGQSISPEARQALRENRLQDAAVILIEEYGLSYVEVTHLLDLSPCEKNSAPSLNRQSALIGRK